MQEKARTTESQLLWEAQALNFRKDTWVLDHPCFCTHYPRKCDYCEAYGGMTVAT